MPVYVSLIDEVRQLIRFTYTVYRKVYFGAVLKLA